MSKKDNWEKFFDGHASEYMENIFTKNTLAEVDFLIEELDLTPGQFILDVGCGTGRHAVELAKRGFDVTGVDLSAGMLAQAQQAAEAASVEVEWVKADATKYEPARAFDAAICLCEGAFGLLGSSSDPIEHDLNILRTVNAALKPEGRFLMTVLSALRHVRAATPEEAAAGIYDTHSMAKREVMTMETPDGPQEVTVRERGYTPTELTLLCRVAGLQVTDLWGGTAGAWNRESLKLDEFEIMITGVKAGEPADL